MTIKTDPLVTVIIPVYNADPYLRTALDSVLDQTYENLQIIIVDDGSTDNGMDTINGVLDHRVTIFRQANSGKSIAMNLALRQAKGKYYAVQDADDVSAPQRIEKLVDIMENAPHIGAVFSGYDLLLNKIRFAPICLEKDEDTCQKLTEQIKMPSHDPTGFYRMEMVRGIKYDPELKIGQGFDYILRVGEKFPMQVVANCLYTYRIGRSSIIRTDINHRALMVKRVWEKACKRRKTDYDAWLVHNRGRLSSLQRGTRMYGVVSHCLESVVCLKSAGRFADALKVGLQCCKINVFNLEYYKPLLYSLVPLDLLYLYRNLKKRYKST